MRWLGAERKAGLPVPWLYVRSRIARAWAVPPWAVDEAPWSEVETAAELLYLTGELVPASGRGG